MTACTLHVKCFPGIKNNDLSSLNNLKYSMFLMQTKKRLEWSSNPTLFKDPCKKQIKFYSYKFEYKTCNILLNLWIHHTLLDNQNSLVFLGLINKIKYMTDIKCLCRNANALTHNTNKVRLSLQAIGFCFQP